VVGDYCTAGYNLQLTCAYHRAAVELHQAIVGILGRWTLAHLLEKPVPAPPSGVC